MLLERALEEEKRHAEPLVEVRGGSTREVFRKSRPSLVLCVLYMQQ